MFQVGLARSNAVGEQGEPNFMIQDLLFGTGTAAVEGDTVEVRYIAFALTAGKLGEVCVLMNKRSCNRNHKVIHHFKFPSYINLS
jgi:hypothetical protein